MAKNVENMTIYEIGTELMACKNAEKGLKARIEKLVEEAVKRGYAGMDIPTVGDENVISLSKDTVREFNEEKAVDVLGAEYVGSVRSEKAKKVKLALSDFGTALSEETKDKICDIVKATVKATVKKKKN